MPNEADKALDPVRQKYLELEALGQDYDLDLT
jgi:hypothetical protein